MDDRIRISDADRERVAARLRDHYAEGRLSSEELDERITATLSAKTVGDLRRVSADLPDPGLVMPPGGQHPPWPMPARVVVHRGPRILPLVLIALIATIALPALGWVVFAVVKVVVLIWLVTLVAGMFAAARFRRHARRYWKPGYGNHWHDHEWRR